MDGKRVVKDEAMPHKGTVNHSKYPYQTKEASDGKASRMRFDVVSYSFKHNVALRDELEKQ